MSVTRPSVTPVDAMGTLLAALEARLSALELKTHSHPDLPAIWHDTYVPDLVSIDVGDTGTNVADYEFTGGLQLGARGHLDIQGYCRFDGTGMVFPTGASRIALPAGFTLVPNVRTWHFGTVRFNAAGAVAQGTIANDTGDPTRLQIYYDEPGATTVSTADPNGTTLPVTWAAGAEFRWTLAAMAQRV